MHVIWLNRSRLSRNHARLIVEAVSAQAPYFAHAWGIEPVEHTFVPLGQEIPSGPDFIKAYFLNNSDQAGALGYHSVDPQGDPYVRVFVDPVIENGGTLWRGPLSVSVCASHEACELSADPACTRQALDSQGNTWAVEVCDPVESCAYEVKVSGTRLSVSDFVLPEFFQGGFPGPWDYTHALSDPFTIAPGGYAIINGQQQFADKYPEWRRVTKEFPAARTWKRTHPREVPAAAGEQVSTAD